MSDVTLHDKARAAIALLVAEHGGIPAQALLEIAWLRGYADGIDLGAAAQALLEIAWLRGYADGIDLGAELADKIIREMGK